MNILPLLIIAICVGMVLFSGMLTIIFVIVDRWLKKNTKFESAKLFDDLSAAMLTFAMVNIVLAILMIPLTK
jgi:hypothetical protein